MNIPTHKNQSFHEVLLLIQSGKAIAYQKLNHVLMDTYWKIGEHLSKQVKHQDWGKSVVKELSIWLQDQDPGIKGFSSQNLWRMKQFYETYADSEKLSPLVRELGWTKNCLIMTQCKSAEEKEFYLKSTAYFHWSKRELETQIKKGSFERTMLSDAKLSPAVREIHPDIDGVFKDHYLLDFLNLPKPYIEKDLQSQLVANLRSFLLELGGGFTFVGEKVRLEVGQRNFELDLLFFHRDLQCLVAFELKTGQFEPTHIGQLSFYLEALDREHKRPHENPSIGVLLCKSKDEEVVELALNATLSPALVSEYETKMISRTLLKQKLHQWSEALEGNDEHV
jgi:predicted nuclease of restriction endonuclease-like (RecB) superfamily